MLEKLKKLRCSSAVGRIEKIIPEGVGFHHLHKETVETIHNRKPVERDFSRSNLTRNNKLLYRPNMKVSLWRNIELGFID